VSECMGTIEWERERERVCVCESVLCVCVWCVCVCVCVCVWCVCVCVCVCMYVCVCVCMCVCVCVSCVFHKNVRETDRLQVSCLGNGLILSYVVVFVSPKEAVCVLEFGLFY